MNVLLTRPLSQVGKLKNLVVNAGHQPLLFPTLEVVALNVSIQRTQYDALIFISANAVDHGLDLLKTLQYSAIYTVGAATAKRLSDRGISVDAFPVERASSEALLALDAVSQLNGKNILIFRGKGGRETLKNGLEKNDNKIEYAQVYDRIVCTQTQKHQQALNALLVNAKGAVSVTSNENLDGLILLASQSDQLEGLKSYPLIVLSQRIRDYALSKGFLKVLVALDTSDEAIVKVLESIDTLDKQSKVD